MKSFSRFTLARFFGTAGRFIALRRVALGEVSGSPMLLVALWLAVAAGEFAIAMISPQNDFLPLSASLMAGGGVVIAGFLAAAILRKRMDAVRLVNAFLLVALAVSLAGDAVALLPIVDGAKVALSAVILIWAVWRVRLLVRSGWDSMQRRWRIYASVSALMASLGLAQGLSDNEYLLYQFSAQARATTEDAEEAFPEIDYEALFGAQPRLLEQAANRLPASRANPRTLVIGVAAGGTQALFGREAHAAVKTLSARFGEREGALLSNAEIDLEKVPLASANTLSELLERAGKGFDRRKDLAVIYLASHGSDNGELLTGLPDYRDLHTISARGLAQALDRAGITRRIVIVSACYSGTWIEPLASPDTIVLTAAAADRSSFGCDDSRNMTVFGEAFMAALRARTPLVASWADLKRRVSEEEGELGASPSQPQVSVGDNMRDLWMDGVSR